MRDETYDLLIHDDMTTKEISTLGTIIMKDKFSKWKNKIIGWFKHEQKQ